MKRLSGILFYFVGFWAPINSTSNHAKNNNSSSKNNHSNNHNNSSHHNNIKPKTYVAFP